MAKVSVFALCVTSFALYVAFAEKEPIGTFYLIHFRAWELGCGVFLFFFLRERKPPRFNFVVFPIGLALLLCVFAAPAHWNQSLLTIATVALTSIVIMSSIRTGLLSFALTNVAIREIGRISYSLYLWHWPVVVLARWTIGLSIETVPVLFVLMLLIAKASQSLIELPFRHKNWGKSKLSGFGIGVSGLLAAVAVFFVLKEPLDGKLYTGKPAPLEQHGVSTLTMPLVARDGSVWAGSSCILSDEGEIGASIPFEDCTLGSWETAENRMLVVGNSFSAAFAGAFREMADSWGWSVLLTSSWGAPVVPEFGFSGPWRSINQYYWEVAVPELIRELREGDVVLIVSDLQGLSPQRLDEDNSRLQDLSDGLHRFSDELAESGVDLAILGPLPFAREAQCTPDVAVSQWFAPNGGPCRFKTREKTLNRLASQKETLADLENSGVVSIVDVFDSFCPGAICDYGSRDGVVLYRDEYSHPSLEAATKTASSFVERLAR